MFLKLAWLNIWRNKKRTLIMMFSISFAVFFTILNQTDKIGFYNGMIKGNVNYYSGYLQIHRNGFWEERSIDHCFQLPDTLINRLSSSYNIESFVPRIETYAMASTKEKTKGIMIVGIDPEKEKNLTQITKKITHGNYIQSDDKQIIIGQGVAEYFKINVGDTIDIIGQGYRGVNAVNRYRVKGIVKYPVTGLNNSVVYLPINECRNLLGTGDLVTTYCLKVNPGNVDNIAASVASQLDQEHFEVMSWKDMLPELLQTIKLIQVMNLFLYGILYLIVGFGIFGTYYMMLNERNFEFAIMIASGMKRGILQRITMMEIALLAVSGLIVGVIISFSFVLYMNLNPIQLTGDTAAAYIRFGVDPVIETPLTAKPFLQQSAVILLLSLGIGSYSIRKINKLEINSAIR